MDLTLEIKKEASGVFSHLDSKGHFFIGNDIKVNCTDKQVRFTYNNPSKQTSTYEISKIRLNISGVISTFENSTDFIKKLKLEGYTGNLDSSGGTAAGGATEAKQDVSNNYLQNIDSSINSIPNIISTEGGAQPTKGVVVMGHTGTGFVKHIHVDSSGAQSVNVNSSSLPTGAATSSNQLSAITAINAVTSAINAPLPSGTNSIGTVISKTQDGLGNNINSISQGSGKNGLLVAQGGNSYIFSTANTSSVQLAPGATFNGTIESTVNSAAVSVLLVSDQNGILTLFQYLDAGGTRVTNTWTFSIVAGVPFSRAFTLNGNYFKASFQNTGASTTTTFNIDTAFGSLNNVTNLGNTNVAINEVNGTALSLGNNTSSSSIPTSQSVEVSTGNITTQNLVPSGVATPGSAVEISLNGNSQLGIQVTGTYTGALSIQLTNDGTNWVTITSTAIINAATGVYSSTISSGTQGIFQVECAGFLKARVTGLSAMTGTSVVTLRAVASTGFISIDNALPTGSNTIGAVNIAASQTLATVTTVGSLTTLANGQTAHSSAVTGSPLRVSGKVVGTTIATQDTTLVAGDASDVGMTTSLQQLVKNNAPSELDYNFIFSTVGTTVTVQPIVQASGTASIRNYIKSLRLSTDTLGSAGNIWLLDGSLTVSSIAITTGLVTTTVAHDLKTGDSVIFTALASGTGVTTNTVYYVTSVGSTTTFNFSASIGGSNIVPSVAYTGTTMYRVLDQIRVQTTSLPPTMINYDEPLRTNPNMAINLLIPSSLTSGSVYLTINGYRGF